MERTERIALLHSLLSRNRYGLSYDRLERETGASRSTLYRDLCFMRDTLGAPLVLEGDPARNWRYENRDDTAFQLPGLWLTSDELFALLLSQQLLQRSGGGPLSQALGPMQPRFHKLLGNKARHLNRLRVLRTQARQGDQTVFRIVTDAVLERRQLRFSYQARSTRRDAERVVSPQRLTHHRDNWYLDAWSESAREDAQHSAPTNARGYAEGRTDRAILLRFAVDRIRRPVLTDDPAVDLPLEQLDTEHDAGYGIFAGPATATAVIQFTADAARWIADEIWHPKQRQRPLPDGGLELSIPYAHPRELL